MRRPFFRSARPHALTRSLLAAATSLLMFAVQGSAMAQDVPFEFLSPSPNQQLYGYPIQTQVKRKPGTDPVALFIKVEIREGQGPWLNTGGGSVFIGPNDNVSTVGSVFWDYLGGPGAYTFRGAVTGIDYGVLPESEWQWIEVPFVLAFDSAHSPLKIVQPSAPAYPGPNVQLVVEEEPEYDAAFPAWHFGKAKVELEIKQQGAASWEPYKTFTKAFQQFPSQPILLFQYVPDKGVQARVRVTYIGVPNSKTFHPSEWRVFWWGPPAESLMSADDLQQGQQVRRAGVNPRTTAVSRGTTGDDKLKSASKPAPGAVPNSGVVGKFTVKHCPGQAIPGQAIISVCCPVELQSVYPGVTAQLACGVASPAGDGEQFGDDVWVNIPLSAAGAFTGELAAHFTAQHFPFPVKPESILLGDAECKLRLFHGGQVLWPHQSDGSAPSSNPTSIDPKVYSSKQGTAFNRYCSWAGPYPSKIEGKQTLVLSKIQFTGQRQRLQTTAAADAPAELPESAARKPKVKARIKGVTVVQGTNLFDPSGQTAAVPTSGQYVGRFAVVSDPCKLEGKIGLARSGQTLIAATRGATMDITGGPPFVKVSGSAAGNPAALSGNGTAAGQSASISASANFGGGHKSLTMDYVMTLPGRCVGNTATNAAGATGGTNAVTYKFTGQKR